MTRINANSINQFMAWGKSASSGIRAVAANLKTASLATLTTTIAALPLFTVGCSSDKPKTISSLGPAPMTQSVTTQPVAVTSSMMATTAPKPVRKPRPANVTYTDKASGVSFQFPRRFALKTGEDADKLVTSIPLPMNFVQPGGVALAAVELPASAYNGNNLSAAFFDVSVNKSLTTEQCSQFAATSAAVTSDSTATADTPLKLVVGHLDLVSTEMLSSQNALLSDGKYFHVYQNGACYEFALHVATGGEQTATNLKKIDRDQVFSRLEKILTTVNVENTTEQVAKEVPASTTTTVAPQTAQ